MNQSQAPAARRPLAAGAPLVRLLATLEDAPPAAPREAFAERLARWFEWREAIELSAALNAPARPDANAQVGAGDVSIEASRVRARLEQLAQDPVAASRSSRRPPPNAGAGNETAVDLALLKERHAAAQRSMAAEISALRARLRLALAAASPALANLAALDEVMEKVVGEHEHVLLAGLPRGLESRFEADDLPGFLRDLRVLLRAELDLRWQAVEALLEALPRRS